MRLNAKIPAFLALAALFLIPATLLAKTTHRRAHKPVVTHSAKAHPARTSSSHKAPEAKLRRAHAHPSTARRTRRISRISTHPSSVQARAGAPQNATSDDFLKAASKTEATAPEPTVHAEARVPARRSRSRSRRTASPAKPVSVVSVIRPAVARPQLESSETVASTPVILPALYNKRGRLIVPPPLKGTREILLRQNEVADRDGLDRIQNDEDLRNMRSNGMLVSLPVNRAMQVDDRLPADRRFCRPWTARFLANLARAHYARFHTPLQVNSAVRTVEFQQRLMRINGNAAPAEGDTASPHLTGQAVDLAKRGLSRTEIAWMRGYLLPLVQEGKIDVEEEFQQACFHISVYKKYLPPATTPRRSIATTHRGEASALATAIR